MQFYLKWRRTRFDRKRYAVEIGQCISPKAERPQGVLLLPLKGVLQPTSVLVRLAQCLNSVRIECEIIPRHQNSARVDSITVNSDIVDSTICFRLFWLVKDRNDLVFGLFNNKTPAFREPFYIMVSYKRQLRLNMR